MRKFEEINITGNKISWNWPAFLFTGWWMLYRKMDEIDKFDESMRDTLIYQKGGTLI